MKYFLYHDLTVIRWELDCPLDRHCMKISGYVQDNVYGYGREVSIRSVVNSDQISPCQGYIRAIAGASFLIT